MASSETVISVKNVSKDFKLPHQKIGSIKSGFTNLFSLHKRSYEVQHALRDIDFEINKGEFFGIVGRNGSGKSTLLKILAGIYQPTKGNVRVDGRIVPFIELGVGFNGDLSGRDNVYLNGAMLGFSEKEIDAKYQDIVDFAELERFMDQKLKNYSSGMQVRLAFSVATRLAESDVLLIDEVLAVGDADFQRKCFSYFKELKKQEKTVVFVSHDMSAVREYCDKAILIEKNEIVLSGTSDEVGTAYTRMFMNSNSDKSRQQESRWGDRAIIVKHVKVSPKKILDQTSLVDIDVVIRSEEDISGAIAGFSIENEAGIKLLGTNSKIMKMHIPDLEAGQEVELKWSFPNVFNSGTYLLNLAIIRDDGTPTDWWDGAARLEVFSESDTPYYVLPKISLIIK